MTNEEIVLSKLNNNRFLGNKPIHFDIEKNGYWFSEIDKQSYVNEFKRKIDVLKSQTSIVDRVRKITHMSYNTYHENGKYQCRAGARRSTCDIWRIYKYYFGDIDIFSIMRALYKLVYDGELNTYRCPDVRKRVYWHDSWRTRNLDEKAELGIPMTEWKDIGLNYGQIKEIS